MTSVCVNERERKIEQIGMNTADHLFRLLACIIRTQIVRDFVTIKTFIAWILYIQQKHMQWQWQWRWQWSNICRFAINVCSRILRNSIQMGSKDCIQLFCRDMAENLQWTIKCLWKYNELHRIVIYSFFSKKKLNCYHIILHRTTRIRISNSEKKKKHNTNL